MQLNKTASRVVDILNLIAQSEKALTITEISKLLNMPKSSTFAILYTLVKKDYLTIENEKLKTFKLGLKLFQAGVSFLSNNSFISIAHPFLERTMEESGETVFLAIEEQGQLVYLDKAEQPSSVRTTIRLGFSKNPIYCSALGKALLASFTDNKVKEIIGDGKLLSITQNTVKNYNALIKQLNEARQRGYAMENGEGDPGVNCVAAPIYDNSNKAVAVISIASPKYRMSEDRFRQLGNLISKTAMDISKNLGFLKERLFSDFKLN